MVNREFSPKSNPHGLGIDHLLFLSRDIDQSAVIFEKLGFTTTPPSLHSAHLGTIQRTLMFQQDYIEIIAINETTPHNQVHRDHLERGEGWNISAITSDSIDGTRTALREAGIETQEPLSFSRPVTLPNGGVTEAAFRVVRPLRERLPNGFMFFCEHFTRDALWVDTWMRHENTARGIASVVISSDDPEQSAALYGCLFAATGKTKVPGGISIESGKARLDFLTPARIATLYSDYRLDQVGSLTNKVVRIDVGDLSAARAVIERNAIPSNTGQSGSMIVAPDHAGGTILEFVTRDTPDLTG
ncbi:MAG: VOC family protein [Proteobacteria bacterium]|nr:MAG: VOC family protein [Pseudomonadota bacterium]